MNKQDKMNHYLQMTLSFLKLQFVFITFLVISLCPTINFAQDKKIKTLPIDLNDTLKFDEKQKGIFNKLAKTLKFKENRNKKEKERIYLFMLELINEKDLTIDSNINEITRVLDSIKKSDLVKIDSIDQKVNMNKQTIDALKAVVIDSFKIALDSVVKDEMRSFFIKQNAMQDSLETTLKALRSTNYSCKCLDNKDVSILNNPNNLCLSPRKQVIGWHNFRDEGYKNYNYHYLSAINLCGFELEANGTIKDSKSLVEMAKVGGVINFAKNNCTDVHLTIFNGSSTEVSEFLRDATAQDKLKKELNKLICKGDIAGVNIYFDVINEGDYNLFTVFVKELYDNLKRIEAGENQELELILNVTIPAIYDDESLAKVAAYDFEKLNSFVDNYLITTDKMTSFDNKWAQSPSPLYTEENMGFGTVQSSVNFYSNGKIPLSKLIVSVSYVGISWPVSNFEGKVRYRSRPYDIQFDKILSEVRSKKDLKNNIEFGLDSIQASAYINIRDTINYFEPRYTQIWYENGESLHMKYTWILDNNLAGVSIRNLGYDNGHTELWDALGRTFIQIESRPKSIKTASTELCKFQLFKEVRKYLNLSVAERGSHDNPFEEGNKNDNDTIHSRSYKTIIGQIKNDSLKYKDIFNTRVTEKAVSNVFTKSKKIKNDTIKESIWFKFQAFPGNKKDLTFVSRLLVKLGIRDYAIYSDYQWAAEPDTNYITEYGNDVLNEKRKKNYLKDGDTCLCLYKRLIIFSKISFFGAGLCVLIIFSLIFWINYLDRFNKGGKLKRNIIKFFTLILGLLTIVLVFYGLYITPYFDGFGASNQGDVSISWLLILMFFGAILGGYVYYRSIKGKYLSKNLP